MARLQDIRGGLAAGHRVTLSAELMGPALAEAVAVLAADKTLDLAVESIPAELDDSQSLAVHGRIFGLRGQASDDTTGLPAALVFRDEAGDLALDLSLDDDDAARNAAQAYLLSFEDGPDAFIEAFTAGPCFAFSSNGAADGLPGLSVAFDTLEGLDLYADLVTALAPSATAKPTLHGRVRRRKLFRSARLDASRRDEDDPAAIANETPKSAQPPQDTTELVLWLEDLPEAPALGGPRLEGVGAGLALPLDGSGNTQIVLTCAVPGTDGLAIEAMVDVDGCYAVFALDGRKGTLADLIAAAAWLACAGADDDPLKNAMPDAVLAPFRAVRLEEAWVAMVLPQGKGGASMVRSFGLAIDTPQPISLIEGICTLRASLCLRVDTPFEAETRVVAAHFTGDLTLQFGEQAGLAIGGWLDLPSKDYGAKASFKAGDGHDALTRLGMPPDGPSLGDGVSLDLEVAGNLALGGFRVRAALDAGHVGETRLLGIAIKFEGVTLSVTHVAGATAWSVEALWKLDDAEFDVEGRIDDGFSFTASMGGELDLSTLVDALFSGAPALPGEGDLKITGVVVEANVKAKTCRVEARTAAPWKPFDGIALDITDLAFDKDETQTTAHLAATVAFGDVLSVRLDARKDKEARGWTFKGGILPGTRLKISDLVEGLHSLFDKGPDTPKALEGFEIRNLEVTVETDTGAASFACAGHLDLDGGHPLDLRLTISREPSKETGFAYHFDAAVTIDALDFKGRVDSDSEMSRLLLAYRDRDREGERSVSLTSLVSHLLGQALPLPEAELAIEDVYFIRESRADTATTVFGADIVLDAAFDFASIPVLRALVGDGRIGLNEAGFVYASAAVSKESVTDWNATFAASDGEGGGRGHIIRADETGAIPHGTSFRATALLGTDPHAVFLSAGSSSPKPPVQAAKAKEAPVVAAMGDTVGSAVDGGDTAEATDGGGTSARWIELGKSLGPLHVSRLGLSYADGKVGVLLDSAVDLAGLHIGLKGLSVHAEIKRDPAIDFGLDGLDLSYVGGPIEIAGAFMRVRQEGLPDRYDGAALLKAPSFAVAGIGSYTTVGTSASLFVFAAVHAELGGPPFFRVQGLAAGFGYNRKLTLPPVEEVQNFPLVRAAKDENFMAGLAGGSGVDKAMEALATYITPSSGDYWLAIGVKFSSFEVVHSVALLTASFGNDVEIGLLGLSSLQLPKEGAEPIVCLELALRVSIKPSTGLVAIEGRLTDASFLLSRDCRISGGFAFYTWCAGEQAGDFVITLGGYHPRFIKPDHYPVVPRLAVDWKVSGTVSLHAELYFALTPSCLMAGGRMSMVYASGGIRAWFVVEADFLMYWEPVHYEIEASVVMGVSVKLWLFTVHAEIGLKVALYGPPFGGTARVNLSVVSFTINFGSHPQLPDLLDADSFAAAFLPGKVLTLGVERGLIREGARDREPFTVVNGHGLCLVIRSAAPITQVSLGGAEAMAGSGAFGIAPMGIKGVKAPLEARLADGAGQAIDSAKVRLSPIDAKVPAAVWRGMDGQTVRHKKPEPSADTLPATLGARLTFTVPDPIGALPPIDVAEVMVETVQVPPLPRAGPMPRTATELGDIADIDAEPARARRRQLLSVLAGRFDLPTEATLPLMSDALHAEGAGYFQADPRVASLFTPEASS